MARADSRTLFMAFVHGMSWSSMGASDAAWSSVGVNVEKFSKSVNRENMPVF